MAAFVAHLTNEGLAHSTIKVYLSAIYNLHITTGHHQASASQLVPRVELCSSPGNKANSSMSVFVKGALANHYTTDA